MSSVSKAGVNQIAATSALEQFLCFYDKWLLKMPVTTKALTSAGVGFIGNIISQLISPSRHAGLGGIWWRSTFAYAGFGFLFNGPLIHHFYRMLDDWVPLSMHLRSAGEASVVQNLKRVAIDRVLLAPPFLVLYIYVIAIFEGYSNDDAYDKMVESIWPVIKMNWMTWTLFQYININYMPQKYRVLFTNILSLGWTTYIAIVQRRES